METQQARTGKEAQRGVEDIRQKWNMVMTAQAMEKKKHEEEMKNMEGDRLRLDMALAARAEEKTKLEEELKNKEDDMQRLRKALEEQAEERRKLEEQLKNMEDEIKKEKQGAAEEAVKRALSEKEEETKAKLREVREQCEKEYAAQMLQASQSFEEELRKHKEGMKNDQDAMRAQFKEAMAAEIKKRADIEKKAKDELAEEVKKQQASEQKIKDLEAEVAKLQQTDAELRKQLNEEGIVPADKAAKVRKQGGTSAGQPEESPLKKARREAQEARDLVRIKTKQARATVDKWIAVQATNFELTKQMRTACQDAGSPLIPWGVVRAALVKKGQKLGTEWKEAWLDQPGLLTKDGLVEDSDFNKFKLGVGSYGVVLAGILDDGMEVAIKFPHKDKDFNHELAYTALCQGPNVIKLLGWTTRMTEADADGIASRVVSKKQELRKVMTQPIFSSFLQRALVMELANFKSLHRYLYPPKQRYQLGPTLGSIVHAFSLGAQGLHDCCHQRGVVHRDLHTSNIMLHKATHQDSNIVVLIGDLGMARPMDEGQDYWSTNNTDEMWAVPDYSPTEWERGVQRVAFKRWFPQDDVHQWGVVMLELLFNLSHPSRIHKGTAGIWPLIIAQGDGPTWANIRQQVRVYATSKALLKFWDLEHDNPEAMEAFINLGAYLLLCCTPKTYNGTIEGQPNVRRPGTMEEVARKLQELATMLSQYEIIKC